MAIISLHDVVKEYKQYKRYKGFWGSFRNLVTQEYSINRAVEEISFSIAKGEAVGLLGQNGAGKSTIIKMLTGILVPTSGHVLVRGNNPHKKRRENNRHIGVVFGQRSQLWWDLPVADSFDLHRHIYKIPLKSYKENYNKYIELLGMHSFITQPVRQLSLGQRMRAEIAISLLHEPDILFLDEPTIGLDIMAKDRIREFLRTVNQEKKVTIILTTHDMKDIDEICPRLLVVNKGKLVYDGEVKQLKEQLGGGQKVTIEFADPIHPISIPGVQLIQDEGKRKHYQFSRNNASVFEQISKIAAQHPVIDVTMRENDIEDVIRSLYQHLEGEGTESDKSMQGLSNFVEKKVAGT